VREQVAGALLRIGTRGSQLARAQASWVQERLRAAGPEAELVIIRTQGDLLPEASLTKIGGKGVFVKELENALFAGEIDFAVHSLKDLPVEIAQGLTIAAVTERVEARDVLCTRYGETLETLAGGARLATSSLRRKAQILAARADLQIVEVRGNLDTRLRKLAEGEFDALMAAAAGLIRLGWQERISEYLPFDISLPAPGQGALAVEVRTEDGEMREIAARLNHPPSRAAAEAERAFLSAMGGGCLAPIGAVGVVEGEDLILRGMVASVEGRRILREKVCGAAAEPVRVGEELAGRLFSMGAQEILSSIPPLQMTGGMAP